MFENESHTQESIKKNLSRVTELIKKCQPNTLKNSPIFRLIAVTKTHPISTIESAYAIGLRDFGENYVNEAIEKIIFLREKRNITDATWHFIGPLQSNKTRLIATHFNWVHSVDRLKIAQRLSEQRSELFPPLQVCIQVNIHNEGSKSGCTIEETLSLALEVIKLPHVELRGLMCIPNPINLKADFDTQCAPFRALKQLFETVKTQLPIEKSVHFDTLSMGMSDDFECAITEGSNCVRLGSALFGQRALA